MAKINEMSMEQLVSMLDDPNAVEKLLAPDPVDTTTVEPTSAAPPASPTDSAEDFSLPPLAGGAPTAEDDGDFSLPPLGSAPIGATPATKGKTPSGLEALGHEVVKFATETVKVPFTAGQAVISDIHTFAELARATDVGTAFKMWGDEFRSKMGVPVSSEEETSLEDAITQMKQKYGDSDEAKRLEGFLRSREDSTLSPEEQKELRRGLVNVGSFAAVGPIGSATKAATGLIPNLLVRRIAAAEMHSIASFVSWEIGTAIADEEGKQGIEEAAKTGLIAGALTPPAFKVAGKALGLGAKGLGVGASAVGKSVAPYLRSADNSLMRVKLYNTTRMFLDRVWDNNAYAGETLLRKAGMGQVADRLIEGRANSTLRSARYNARVTAAWDGLGKDDRILLGQMIEGQLDDAALKGLGEKANMLRKRADEIGAVTKEIAEVAEAIGLPHYDPVNETMHRFVPRKDFGLPHWYVDTIQYTRPGPMRDRATAHLMKTRNMTQAEAESFLERFHKRNMGEVAQVLEGKRKVTGSVAVIGRRYDLPGYELDPSAVLPSYLHQMSSRIENHLRFSHLPAGLRSVEELAAVRGGPPAPPKVPTPAQGPAHPPTSKPEVAAGELAAGDTVWFRETGEPVKVLGVDAKGTVTVKFPGSPSESTVLKDAYSRVDVNAAPAQALPGPGKWHAVIDFADDMIATATERMTKRNGGKLNAFTGFIDPADVVDITHIGVGYMLKGAATFAEWSTKMVTHFGESVKPHLEGLYKQVNEAFEARRPRGNDEVRTIANDYMAKSGQGPVSVPAAHPELDTRLAQRVAKEYNKRANRPDDLKVRAAYRAFVDETKHQYDEITAAGYKLEPFQGQDPYGVTARNMMDDVRGNRRLQVYSGSLEHPLLTPEENWMFRAVHDFFGHSREGYDFGPKGENAAFLAHAQMYSRKALPAMATETRGQNSWVNFFGDNPNIPVKERPFAEQKAMLLPEWAYSDALKMKDRPKAAIGAGMKKAPSENVSNEHVAARLAGLAQKRPVHDPIEMELNAVADGLDGAKLHLKAHPESAGFYHADLNRAMKNAATAYPELSDPAKAGMFKLVLAGSSQASKPVDNFAYTTHIWDRYRELGKVPFLSRSSKELGVFGRTFAKKTNDLLAQAGGNEQEVVAYLLRKDKDGAYNAINEYGPKIGAFWLNNMGVHDVVTVDRWMIRWFRRINGRPFDKQGNIVDVPSAEEAQAVTNAVTNIAEKVKMHPDEVQAILWDREKRVWHQAGARDSGTLGFGEASELVLRNRLNYARSAFGERVPGQGEMF